MAVEVSGDFDATALTSTGLAAPGVVTVCSSLVAGGAWLTWTGLPAADGGDLWPSGALGTPITGAWTGVNPVLYNKLKKEN